MEDYGTKRTSAKSVALYEVDNLPEEAVQEFILMDF